MSEIFLATQSGVAGFRKLVVLKTILPNISGEEDFVRMFLEEARISSAFNHPNIAQVFELDVDDGTLFMAIEFVQGCTLVEMARACRQAKEAIPVGFTLQAVRDTALALHYAHNFTDARGRKQVVIHRDVAEKNIMVTYEGVTKLLDFGIAKALGRTNRTTVGMVKGTSGYMSPEQIRGEPLDGRSDVFSLGVVLHECLTGMRLFHGKRPEDGMLAALKETAQLPSRQNPEVTADIDAIVMKALSKSREDRFSTALEMARAIEKAAPGAIWLPEQTAELVSRHFVARRDETRQLLESAGFGSDPTGAFLLDKVLEKVRDGGKSGPIAPPTVSSKPKPPPTPPVPAPTPLNPPPSAPTRTDEVPAPDARPKVLRGEVPSKVGGVTPKFNDDVSVKTTPASALDESRARKSKRTEEPPKPPPPKPPTVETGETQALTLPRAPEKASDDEADDEALTTVVSPSDTPGGAKAIAGAFRDAESRARRSRTGSKQMPVARSRNWPLVVTVVVLLVVAVAAVLFALELPPFQPAAQPTRKAPVPTPK
ncbi:MAG: serine/threonine protein kinase [Archangium sp.]|nr:serine/threonine protein kinase [Archangium sp.]